MIPKKAKNRINKTKSVLRKIDETFENYMRETCQRYIVFSLGEEVNTKFGKGIICGWNRSSNYDVYIYERDEILNMHPNSIERAKDEYK